MNKNMIAPIIVGILMAMYFLFYFYIIAFVTDFNIFAVIVGLIIAIIFIALMIYTVKQRYSEIESGEEDDLSKYWLYLRKRTWDAWASEGKHYSNKERWTWYCRGV